MAIPVGQVLRWHWRAMSQPIATSSIPAMRPAVSSPERPKRDTIGARTTTKAAVGPVTWNFDPPVNAATVPATTAV